MSRPLLINIIPTLSKPIRIACKPHIAPRERKQVYREMPLAHVQYELNVGLPRTRRLLQIRSVTDADRVAMRTYAGGACRLAVAVSRLALHPFLRGKLEAKLGGDLASCKASVADTEPPGKLTPLLTPGWCCVQPLPPPESYPRAHRSAMCS